MRERRDLWLLALAPVLVTLAVAFFLPVLFLAANSLHRSTGMGQVGEEFTLDNYWSFLRDPFYLGIMLETFWLGAIVVMICVVLGYPVAYVLARMRSRWRGLLVFLVVAPLLVSVVIRNLGLLPLLSDSGLVNWALAGLGLTSEPLRLANNFTGVVIGLVHAMLPFMILMLTTVLLRIEPELEDAAAGLGAGPWSIFWRVLLPLSRPGLLAGYLVVFTISISAYTTPAMLGGRRVLVMAVYIAQQVRNVLDYAVGATASVVLLVCVAAVTLASVRDGNQQRWS
jgi:putative spermidine/putrescine transport system permease protein